MISDIIPFFQRSSSSSFYDREILGGKGAGLCEMVDLGIPVPPGFIITTGVCKRFYSKGSRVLETSLLSDVKVHIAMLEKQLGRSFGSTNDNNLPLVVSVRSGAVSSMPGMMDTILNLGLNSNTVEALARKTNKRFAYDSYRRFIQMYSSVVFGIAIEFFEDIFVDFKSNLGVTDDSAISAEYLQKIIDSYKKLVKKHTGKDFPDDVYVQLNGALKAVLNSWMNERAIFYRKMHNIPDDVGTAVIVQSMVYGNLNDNSGSGVIFSRDPTNGNDIMMGEYLMSAQGEDVVSGIRTPVALHDMKKSDPKIYENILSVVKSLENHYKDMQDVEFTIQDGMLWILQTRSGKRSAGAAVKLAVDFVKQGLIDKKEAIRRISSEDLEGVLHPVIDYKNHDAECLAKGLPASPGAVFGRVVFNSEDAINNPDNFESIILVRNDTSPEDIEGMSIANGILTVNGGMTSHAAVVARGMGRACVCGVGDIHIDCSDTFFKTASGKVIKYGDFITIDGTKGYVLNGKVATESVAISDCLKEFISWLGDYSNISVRANADTIDDTKLSIDFGADGIGLCRTEHMFFSKERINKIREMIMSDSRESRDRALAKLTPMQKKDFKDILRSLNGKALTVRLLDPPLHEFLPKTTESIKALSMESGFTELQIKDRITSLHEINPMLGSRGCRLSIAYPEIYGMQVEALMLAIKELKDQENIIIDSIEVMIPFIVNAQEFYVIKSQLCKISDKYDVKCSFGNMIEVPAAVINAGDIAKYSDFFSFGTNDLTQTVLALSRDDTSFLISKYVEEGIFKHDPFQVIDESTVGFMIKEAIRKGLDSNSSLKIGICGEQAGNLLSIRFLSQIKGIDYLSCSPYRVPIAKLALAKIGINDD
ncbi:pyruvate, phosphate dikinase [Anaplasmataceae bacterium AB001_6]|nr:pyruvate, phosphate dikinase [Anaplasmataceae bacterium AB001_6]